VAKAKREIESYVNQTNGLPSNIKLDVLSLKDLEYQSLESCAVLIAFTLLLLLAFNWRTAVRLRATGPHRTVAEFLRWWLFFVAKTILLLVIVLIVSLDLVQMAVLRFGGNAQQYAGGAVMWLFLVGLTVALSWSIRDQLARCRTCLRRLRIQVDLGGSSSVFCEPSGVELVCDEGHGILHLPVMQFSCVDSERWTELDDSWQAVLATHQTQAPIS
jgi:hypothetical protein